MRGWIENAAQSLPEGTWPYTCPALSAPRTAGAHWMPPCCDWNTPSPPTITSIPASMSSSNVHAPLLGEDPLWGGCANTPPRLGRAQWWGYMCSVPKSLDVAPATAANILLSAVCLLPSLSLSSKKSGALLCFNHAVFWAPGSVWCRLRAAR